MNRFLPEHFYFDGAAFFIGMTLIMATEKRFPAMKNQLFFSNSFFQDSIWFVLGMVGRNLAIIIFAKKFMIYINSLLKKPILELGGKKSQKANFVTHSDQESYKSDKNRIFGQKPKKGLFQQTVNFPVSESISGIPNSARFILGILAADFLAWFQHRLKHSIPFFWSFHEVHHNQIQLNSMTASRIHFVDHLIVQFCLFAPLIILGVETFYIAAFGVFMNWQIRAYHANIKSNMGFLRYVFVTPQSHRIHHSIESRHQDRNFGVIFSFWDRLFGTQYDGCSEYPAVGVKNPEMPLEDQSSLSSMIRMPLQQLIYPFISILRSQKRSAR